SARHSLGEGKLLASSASEHKDSAEPSRKLGGALIHACTFASAEEAMTYQTSSRSHEYRQKAADAKNRAAQAKDETTKSRLKKLAVDWIALAEQTERIDREKSPPSGFK